MAEWLQDSTESSTTDDCLGPGAGVTSIMSLPAPTVVPGHARLLIVDDDAGVRRAIARILSSVGYQISESGGADEALELLAREGQADLMLSDLQMPGRDGLDLLADVRHHYPDMAVVMLTGQTEYDTAVKCLTHGAVDFLGKPVSAQDVRARVAKALENRALALELRALRARYQGDLERQVQELSSKNQRMFLAQVQMAVGMLEAKDRYTRGHSHRVAEYAVATGHQMGLSASMLEQLRLGGELHDIGKIGTRDAVLHKPGKLTEEEFAEIRLHTVAGEEMLSVLRDEHPEVLHIVRWHHERIDGSGFPDGLVGDRIPLAARIVAVVDAFDAMTTTRSYRAGLSPATAMDELARCAGAQFDAAVVDAFRHAAPDFATITPS